MQNGKQLALDLDGVLADFVRGAFEWHGRSLPYQDVQWDFGAKLFDDPKDFWNPLGYGFWSTLNWTPNGKLLLSRIFHLVGEENIFILSSPCDTPGSNEGKIAWIQDHIPQLRRAYFLSPCKTRMATTDIVLVDDGQHNVRDWRVRGGPAVLVPQPWNSEWLEKGSHVGDDYSVDYVMKKIEEALQ